MRVGVLLGFSVPEAGGEFTYHQAISKALVQVAQQSRHKFIIFGDPSLLMPASENCDVVPIKRTLIKRVYSLIYRHVSRVARTMLFQVNPDPEWPETKIIKKYNVDMIWYVGPFSFTMDIPYLYTLLDLQHLLQPYFPEISNKNVWNVRQKHYSVALRRAAHILISTATGKAEIERFYQVPSERITVLPYAAPQDNFNDEDNNEWVLKKYNIQKDYLFYPAQFWPQKNHVGLLCAVQLLRDKWNISIPVVFVGSDKGNQSYVTEWITRLGLSRQVHMLGFVPRKDLIALYRNALALSMPTLVGPDNIPSLEAFALQCPVITSNLEGFEEQLGDAALFFDPKDEEQIALAIKAIYEDQELRQRLIQRGLERIALWSWTDYVKGVFKVLDEFEPIRRTWKCAETIK